jgi:hypothetical protein
MENLVARVDDLDCQINLTKDGILQGVFLTAQELDLFMEKIAQRTRLNDKLGQVREGESL